MKNNKMELIFNKKMKISKKAFLKIYLAKKKKKISIIKLQVNKN